MKDLVLEHTGHSNDIVVAALGKRQEFAPKDHPTQVWFLYCCLSCACQAPLVGCLRHCRGLTRKSEVAVQDNHFHWGNCDYSAVEPLTVENKP